MSISDTEGLTGLEGLESLTTVGGGLVIQDNDSLLSLEGLSSLSAVGGSLSVYEILWPDAPFAFEMSKKCPTIISRAPSQMALTCH